MPQHPLHRSAPAPQSDHGAARGSDPRPRNGCPDPSGRHLHPRRSRRQAGFPQRAIGKGSAKSADRALTNVFAAIRHALAEADLTIPDFGTLRAARRETGREIRIRFHPDEKLKQAVEARLHAGP